MSGASLERILIPTDLSDLAALALRYGAFFSHRLGSRITLLYADEMFVPQLPIGYYLENAGVPREQQLLALTEQAREYAPGVKVETLVVADRPSRAIVRTAADVRADLIIMGTHGRQGFDRAMLGSVAERVLRHSDRPVLTVAPSHFPKGKDVAVRTILCPVNFKPISRLSADYAANLAATLTAELILLYVDEGAHAYPLSTAGAELAALVAPKARERIRYREVITHGDVSERVLAIAEEVNADLIVIGAQHKVFRDSTVIGSTSERVTRFAPRPVLTVPLRPQKETAGGVETAKAAVR